MNRLKNISWLYAILVIGACQAFPFPAPIPTAVPSITPGGPTLTPSPTVTPAPLPTMPPVVRIEAGDQALFYGDFDLARQLYLGAYNDSTDVFIWAAALWGLGRTELADDNYQTALDRLNSLISEYPESTYSAQALLTVSVSRFPPRPRWVNHSSAAFFAASNRR